MIERPLKFCMVTTFYPPYNFGGDGIFIYRLVTELARLGHTVDVVHCVDAYETLSHGRPRPSEEYPSHPRVTVHSLRSRAGMLSPLITHQTGHPGLKAPRLKEILNSGKFDVIHFHNISLIGPVALSYGTGIKLYTLHEHWLVCPLHVLWKFNREACMSKQCLPCTIHAGRPPQLWRYTNLLNHMLKHVDAFIVPSQFTLQKHTDMGLRVEAPLVHIPHFLPYPQATAPIASNGVGSDNYFLFAGRLEKMKGVHELIRVFQRYFEGDLLIAGEGNYEVPLRRLARGLDHVHFLGRVPYPNLQSLLRKSIALVVPSVGYEVFPMVILEAFAQKTPVIAHNTGPLPELVNESGGGLIYTDEAQLLETLAKLRSDPVLREDLGERGYQAYLKHWTPEAHLRHYFELIEEIAQRKQVTIGTSFAGASVT